MLTDCTFQAKLPVRGRTPETRQEGDCVFGGTSFPWYIRYSCTLWDYPDPLKCSHHLKSPKPRLQKWFVLLQSLPSPHILKRRSSKDLPVTAPLWSSSEKVSDGLVISQMKGTTEVQIIGIKWARRTLRSSAVGGKWKLRTKERKLNPEAVP